MDYIAKSNKYNKTYPDESDKTVYVRNLQRELFYTWCFLAKEDLLDEASEFLEEHREIPSPLEGIAL